MVDPISEAPAAPTAEIRTDLRKHPAFESVFLADARDLVVYVPPGYEQDAMRRYPVLYLHDGQNLFEGATRSPSLRDGDRPTLASGPPDGRTAFVPGQDWHVNDTAEELIKAGVIEPLIIVGVYNTGTHRIDEYTPTRDRRHRAGGDAALYGRMLTEELKPFIDREYRTLVDPAHTGLGGSSLGGLATLYLGLQHPNLFGKLAVLSPSVWWDNRVILEIVRMTNPKPRLSIWLDIGTREGDKTVRDARALRDELMTAGWVIGSDLVYAEIPEAGHNEAAWAARVGPFLQFLFPASPVNR
jgi:predicted alpha/beta superfamily hydrolase